MKYRNLSDLFWKREEKYRGKVLLRHKKRLHQPFTEITWDEAGNQIREIAYGLRALGVKRQDRVCLLSLTSHYWFLCDLGIIAAGACTVPIYHSSSQDTVEYIVNHSEAEIIFVRNKIQLQKIRAKWDELINLRYAIVMVDGGDLPENDPRIITLDELIQMGHDEVKKDPNLIDEVISEADLDDMASIIYTSGTTGVPKGVVLSHRNILTAALTFYQYVPLDDNTKILSFLPLAHVFERIASQFYGIDQGVSFTYCERPEHMPQLLQDSGAQVMMFVPRMLEKIHAKVMLKLSKASFLKKKIFQKALDLSIEYHKKKIKGEEIDRKLETAYKLAKHTVLKKARQQISPTMRTFIVGGAPLSEDLCYFFLALGFNVLEGYGLTETTAAIAVNPMWANKPGTVGVPFQHFEVKIEEDGEIMCRGPAVFSEYYKAPETTAEAFSGDWFHTGDIGELDDEGYLKITGRKKDMLITASGKNIIPVAIENQILQSKYINQIVVLGDNEKYLAALITVNKDEVENYMAERDMKLDHGEQYEKNPEIKKLIRSEIRKYSTSLASFEQLKAFYILQNELSIDGGELTPTLKIRRSFIREKYRDIIQPLFHKTKEGSKA